MALEILKNERFLSVMPAKAGIQGKRPGFGD